MDKKEKHVGVIYSYTAPNGKKYIGQTRKTILRRAGNDGVGYSGNELFWKAIQKYGWNNFELEILFTIKSINLTHVINQLNEKEKIFIKQHKSNDSRFGYNLTPGGKSYIFSEEQKRKISKARTGMKFSESHIRSLSVETKRRWESGVFTEERNRKVSESNKHPKTAEHAKNISSGRRKAMSESPEQFAYLKSPDFKGHRFKKGHSGTRGSLGMRWYNDGVKNFLCLPKDAGMGYTLGRLK